MVYRNEKKRRAAAERERAKRAEINNLSLAKREEKSSQQ